MNEIGKQTWFKFTTCLITLIYNNSGSNCDKVEKLNVTTQFENKWIFFGQT